MHLSGVRSWWLLTTIALATPSMAQAQSPRCIRAATVRGLTGGMIGAGLGFFTAKVKLSDWDDASRGVAAHRMKNRYTIGGALVGVTVGALLHLGGSCDGSPAQPTLPMASPTPAVYQPITLDEITRSGISGTVYDVVYSLRHSWLNLRGIDALTEGPQTLHVDGQTIELVGEPRLQVYLDNARIGSVDKLQTLPTTGVLAIRYFSAAQATYRWGAGHTHGAIQVLTSLP
jgi:hypothetical protein